MAEVLGIFFIPIIFQWIRPEQIAHGTKRRRLGEPVNLKSKDSKTYEHPCYLSVPLRVCINGPLGTLTLPF